ncbi:hypothetical protein RB653_005578 [Dictyostelium firmibasis]|uniref:Uncharacterized protein n=1 Tax=Dictyostelium firmibasis TaxID=79012 RepID=A0AAN7Z178_9MYCE
MEYHNNNFFNTFTDEGKKKFEIFINKQTTYSLPMTSQTPNFSVCGSPNSFSQSFEPLNKINNLLSPNFSSYNSNIRSSSGQSSPNLSSSPNIPFPISISISDHNDDIDLFLKNLYIHYFFKNKINETDFKNCIKSEKFDFDFKDRTIQFKLLNENKFENIFIFIKNDVPIRAYEPFNAKLKNGKWVITSNSFPNSWVPLNSKEFDKVNSSLKCPLNNFELKLQTSIYLCENLCFYLLTLKIDENLFPTSNNIIKEVLKPSFNQLESYCKNDRLLYMFYRLIQADYGFYQHCLHILEASVGLFLKSCILIPRGSFGSKTGLKETIDLDVDLIIPREILTPEKTDPSQFQAFLKNLNIMITNRNNYMKKFRVSNKIITRSIEYKMNIEGIEILVDLFPKLINNDGKIVSLSHEKNGIREWIESGYDIFSNDKKFILSEEQTASILFIKLFKNDIIEKINDDNSFIYLLKAYHLLIAVEKVSQKNENNNNNKSQNKFKIESVFKLMIDVVEFLLIAYQKEPVLINNKNKFKPLPFNKYNDNDFINDGCNPFLDDTIDYSKEVRTKLVYKLYELREIIENYQIRFNKN